MSLPVDEHFACNGLRKPCSSPFEVLSTSHYKNPLFLHETIAVNVRHIPEFLQMSHHVFVAIV